MAASMTVAVAVILVAVPFASAAALAATGSWRIGIWINAISCGLQFAIACALLWFGDAPPTCLVVLTAFVAMTTSGRGRRDIAASLAARSLSRRGAQLYHVGFQVLIGAVQAATLADDAFLTWLALVVAVAAAAVMTGVARRPAAAAAASRLVLHCAIGLTLALLGTLLLEPAAWPATLFLVVGYGALAGLVPLHGWLAAAAREAVAPVPIVVALMANVPMLLFMRLPIVADVPIAIGLVSLLAGAVALFVELDRRCRVALAGASQLGMVAFAIGIGARPAAWLLLTLLTLARTAVLQAQSEDLWSWLAFALLPLYALYLLAAPAAAVGWWLLAPLAAGALLAASALLARRPTGISADRIAAVPVWLQLGLILLLAFAAPARVVALFGAASSR
jgi:hydrogenase-4 component F